MIKMVRVCVFKVNIAHIIITKMNKLNTISYFKKNMEENDHFLVKKSWNLKNDREYRIERNNNKNWIINRLFKIYV